MKNLRGGKAGYEASIAGCVALAEQTGIVVNRAIFAYHMVGQG